MAKGKKDPNAPKKPLSGYFIFSAENRAAVKEEDPDRKLGDIAKRLGEMWGELDDAAKKPYLDKAEKAKEQYKKDLAVYNENKPEEDDEDDEDEDEPKKKKRKVTKEKDPNAPKKPLTAYFLFLADKRASVKAENPNMPAKELVTELGRQWSAMDDETKQVYIDQNVEEKAKYETAMKEYTAN